MESLPRESATGSSNIESRKTGKKIMSSNTATPLELHEFRGMCGCVHF